MTKTNKCNGCRGQGWIETSNHEVMLCPVCLGNGERKSIDTPQLPSISPFMRQGTGGTSYESQCPTCGGDRSKPGGTGCAPWYHYHIFSAVATGGLS